ncbi:hypothetical protein [Vibrio furnissii]|uniref:hypothetical protein n=1 Tax=Vibrio furnissii TaxID=29494 RepID=UPI001EEC51B9|nr:hypothetical protein [Vibrio furnissii]MCG6216330.1 hypothetical protein [Vibrio furnissii]
MKWIMMIFACLSLVFTSPAFSVTDSNSKDLTQFDQPFLLGDWYLVNPNPEESRENFLAIKLNFSSDYTFAIDIQKKDYSVDHWEGMFAANNDTIILGLNSDEPQVYEYKGNHNLLHLNGVTFTKALSNALAGIWSSTSLSGNDLSAESIQSVDLILQPDFVFLFRASGDNGTEAIHRGVYYTEGNHLVLMYEDGEHDTRYTLNQNQLTLEVEDGSMFAVMDRIR